MKKKQPSNYEKVQVWIYHHETNGEPKFLLFLTNKKRGEFWQPVTGSVEPDDPSLEAAALREASEESGLNFVTQPEPLGMDFEFDSKWGRAHEFVYTLKVPSAIDTQTEKIKVDPHEHQSAKWCTAKEALGLVKFESNRAALLQLLERLKP